jgi:hypothetical protein
MRYIFTVIALMVISTVQAQLSMSWVKTAGGTAADQGNAVAVDASGNVYVTGSFKGTNVDFDPGAGTFNLTAVGDEDIFVLKLSPTGTFMWARQFGANDADRANAIKLDASGNVYIAGTYRLSPTFDAFPLNNVAGYDIFVAKLNGATGAVTWAKSMGGSGADQAFGIGLDPSGNVYTAGSFSNTADFDPGINVANLTSVSNSDDIFISKLDNNGNYIWAKGIGGNGNDGALAATVNSTGIYITGEFENTVDFDPGAGVTSYTSNGGWDIFAARYDLSGNMIWAGGIGANIRDAGYGITADGSGNAYVTGAFQNQADFDPGPGTLNLTPSANANYDIFVAKFNSNGTLNWAKNFGDNGDDLGQSIALDGAGNVYSMGSFKKTVDFDPGAGTANLTFLGNGDIYILKLTNAGNFGSVTQIGGPSNDDSKGGAITVNSENNVYLTGAYRGNTDFDPGAGTTTITSNGGVDFFIEKFGQAAGAPPLSLYFRSVTSGNWNDVNTWQWSSDGVFWNDPSPIPADHSPTYLDRTINIRNTHTVTVTQNESTDETTIESGGTLSPNNAITLSIVDGTNGDGFDLTINGTLSGTGTGRVIIQSNSLGTASIGMSTGNTTNNNTEVWRYVPAKRAWRFLAPQVSGTRNINQVWQEGQGGNAASNTVPGFGTHITGGLAANGFDQNALNNPSLKVYVNTPTATPDQNNWVGLPAIPGTNVSINTYKAYMLFVRGSRATNMAQLTGAAADNTTLRITGTLRIGDQSSTVDATGWTPVGNPYAAPFNLNNIAKLNSTNVADNFYVWDPKMTGTYGVGAYVNLSWNGANYTIAPAPTSPVSQYIQSGEAFFAKSANGVGTGTLTIKEADKNLTGSDDVFRLVNGAAPQDIRINLLVVQSDGTSQLLDGAVSSYSSSFNTAARQNNSPKLTNFNENIGIVRNGETFIVERKQSIGDPINLKVWQLYKQNYQIQVVAENIDDKGLSAFVYDSYLKTSTPVDLNGTTTVNFTVTDDPASAASNRFTIQFAKQPVTVSGNEAISIFPNPVTNGNVNLRFNNLPAGVYTIRVFNSLGQAVINKQVTHTAGNSVETLRVTGKGMYQVEVTKPDNSKFSGKIIAN